MFNQRMLSMFRPSNSNKLFAQSKRFFSTVREPKSNMMAYALGGAGVAGMGFLAMKSMTLTGS
jgi:hypothetical protein